jgi:ABC-type glycerol-3-phosphate transport system substrate-binding protein
VKALTFWKQVVDAQGYDSEKALALTLSEGIFEITDGNAAISFCGTFIYSKYGTTERDRGQIGVMDWFSAEHGRGSNYYEISWAAGFGANKNSQYLSEAKQFLEYLMSSEAASLWAQHVRSPYPVIVEEVSEDSLYGMLR